MLQFVPVALISTPSHCFSNESTLPMRWSKYWSFSISPSNEYSGLISFRTVLFCLNWQFPPTIWHLLPSLWNSLRNSAVVEVVSIFCLLAMPCSCHATQKRTLWNPSSWQKLFACLFLSGRHNLKVIRVSATYHLEHVFIKLLRTAEENLLKVKCK